MCCGKHSIQKRQRGKEFPASEEPVALTEGRARGAEKGRTRRHDGSDDAMM
jgi:hypothetical protein